MHERKPYLDKPGFEFLKVQTPFLKCDVFENKIFNAYHNEIELDEASTRETIADLKAMAEELGKGLPENEIFTLWPVNSVEPQEDVDYDPDDTIEMDLD